MVAWLHFFDQIKLRAFATFSYQFAMVVRCNLQVEVFVDGKAIPRLFCT
jgi:hypothetical protein